MSGEREGRSPDIKYMPSGREIPALSVCRRHRISNSIIQYIFHNRTMNKNLIEIPRSSVACSLFCSHTEYEFHLQLQNGTQKTFTSVLPMNIEISSFHFKNLC